ncbi:signal recognition particle receptor subunit alpha [Candidatus Dependentiae bacterium]|nr:signal recognition particle receptor subunit alpha [Candidatus Dependentiae bacterium]
MLSTLSSTFSSILGGLTGRGALTDTDLRATLTKVEEALLAADVPYQLVQSFIADVRQQLIGTKGRKAQAGEQVVSVLYKQLTTLMGGSSGDLDRLLVPIPSTIMLVGLQGSGKTTTAGKLAYRYLAIAAKQQKKRSILLTSVDFDRPAALEQLAVLAQQIGCQFYRPRAEEAIAATREIVAYAKEQGIEYLILDTAGRMHVDTLLIEQLKAIAAIARPRVKWLVMDGMIGQQSLAVAQEFNAAIGLDGAIVTKMDSNATGGAIIAFHATVKKPVIALGQGEKMQELEPVYPERIAQRIIGMGDLTTLMERAQEAFTKEEQEKAAQSLATGAMTLDDFLGHLQMMRKIGSLSSMLQYIPGMGQLKLTPAMIEQAEKDITRARAIISSMTLKERRKPQLLNQSRKARIAAGAGVLPQQIEDLLVRFEETQRFVKLLKKNSNFAKF